MKDCEKLKRMKKSSSPISKTESESQLDYWNRRARGDDRFKSIKSYLLISFFRTGFVGFNRIREYFYVNKNLIGTTVLDAGCGDGSFMSKLKKINKNSVFYGFDFSHYMIKHAKKRGMLCCVSNLTSINFRDETFDTSYAVRSLKNLLSWEMQKKALSEISRVTKYRVIIFDSFKFDDDISEKYNYFLDEKKLVETMREFGFVVMDKRFYDRKSSLNPFSSRNKELGGFVFNRKKEINE